MANPLFVVRDRCPACGSQQFREVYRAGFTQNPIRGYLESFYASVGRVELEYLEGADYVLCDCSRCGLIFQREILGDFLMGKLYGEWIDPQKALEQHRHTDGLESYSYMAQEVMQILAHIGKNPTELRVLDFGMGWGQWIQMAKAFGCQVYGSELSQDRIAHAEANGVKVVGWDEIPRQRFDFINTEQVFEHLPNPAETLQHLQRGLEPGGLLKISVPTATDIEARLRRMDWSAPKGSRNSLNPVAPLEHVNFFRRHTFGKLAELSGMREVFIPLKTQYQYTTKWSGLRRIAKNLALPLHRSLFKTQNYVLLTQHLGGAR